MPELPEVETVANGVHARIQGDRIEEAWFSAKPEPMKTPPAAMAEALRGRTIERVHRVGKHIVFDFAPEPAGDPPRDPVQWIVHLGMTGRLLVAEADTPRPPHTHGVLHLRSGRELRFVDARRFGRMGLHPVANTAAKVSSAFPKTTLAARIPAGKDALLASTDAVSTDAVSANAVATVRVATDSASAAFRGPGFLGSGQEPLHISLAGFRALFRGRRTSIKAALLNQSLLQGVGNIYADESLFRAGIRPRRMAARLTTAQLDRLHAAVQTVLREAIALGGSSVSDYVDAAGTRGFFQLEHRVYMRTGQPCLVCQTPIRRLLVAGRGTHYCPVCQH